MDRACNSAAGNIISVWFEKHIQISYTCKKFGIKQYTNLIINYPKVNFWIDREFNAGEKKRVQGFFNQHTKKLFSKGEHGLYQLM
jgi:hypothetical protein